LPRNLLDAIAQAGVDVGALALGAGIEPRSLETGVSFAEADRFMAAAWTALDDPAFGLRAGGMLRPERFSVVGIAAMSSPSLGVALERKARYNRLIWGDVYEVMRRGPRAMVRIASNAPPRPYSQARIDLELASLLTFARLGTGRLVAPLEVTLRQPEPSYGGRYREVFGCPVGFSREDDGVVFDARDLDLPLVSENSAVGAALVEAAEAQLGRLEAAGADGFRPRAVQAVRRLLRGSEPTLAAVAAQLHMGERTLQRRLAEHELSFTALLDEVRRESALEYLRQHRVTVEEVAFLLGFSTPSSFFRAFKRWTGQTPQGWRRSAWT
jgi:AraC-like DNA-binding protein